MEKRTWKFPLGVFHLRDVRLYRTICLLLLGLVVHERVLACGNEVVDERTGLKADTVMIYRDCPTGKLYVYYPEGKKVQNSPVVAFFFGGGWSSGSPKQFEPQANYLKKYGITVVLADYRTKNNAGTTPKEALMDARSVMRYLKKHALSIGGDPERIVVGGGSAGGHLAAATAFCDNLNNPEDDLSISAIPKALILFNPVVDNSAGGYGFDRVKEYYEDFSPILNIKRGAPPAIFFLGTKDNFIPVETGQKFKEKMEAVGARCDLLLYPEQKHGFFNSQHKEYFEKTMTETVKFLKSLGYISSL